MMRLERPRPLVTRPRVSVVVPCYNYGHFLGDAVRSALDDQPGMDVDVLIVDDASPDGSGDVARTLAANDERVDVLQHDVNQGHIQTFNDGLRAVSGDYVVLLSADDLLSAGSLSRSVALLESHPNVGFVYGWAQWFDTEPHESTQALRSWSLWRGGNWYAKRARDLRNVILSPEVVMRRKLVDELGYYDPGLPHSSDMYLWLRASRVADVGRVNGPIQAHYRVHGNNMHLTDFGGAVADLRERARTWRRLADGAPVGARTHVEAQRAASRAIAREAVTTATAIAQVDGAEVESVRELRRMAKDAWPAIAESRRWRRLHAIGTAGASVRRRSISHVLDRLQHKVRWRLWRRYGV